MKETHSWEQSSSDIEKSGLALPVSFPPLLTAVVGGGRLDRTLPMAYYHPMKRR